MSAAPAARRRRVLVKYGGATLDDGALRARLAADIAAAVAAGHELIVVHGGGPQTTALAERLGLQARFAAGRRITDAAMLDVVAWTLVGGVATSWLAALLAAGVRAVATPVASGGLLRATRRPPRRVAGASEPVDFGEVADPAGVDPALAEALWAASMVPVLSPLCVDAEGRRLNLNADTAARALAVGLQVDDVITVADVPGVFGSLGDPSTHFAELAPPAIAAMIACGAVRGGMIAKLEELVYLVHHGVDTAWIVGAHERSPVSAALSGEPGLRTRVRLAVAA